MKGPPTTLRLNAVPAYLLREYGATTTSQTVRNWVKLGYKNESLQTRQVKSGVLTRPWIMVTTEEWVDEFIIRCGLPVTKLEKQ